MILHFRHLRSIVNANYARKVALEGSTSLLIQQATAVIVLVFCFLVSSFQYFGHPIQCVQDKKDEDAAINEQVMNSFCYIASTYTVTQDNLGFECNAGGSYYASPGLGPNPMNEGNIRRHSYYIWIPFVLFFQALTFLLPYSYWSYCEGGLIRKLLNGVTGFVLEGSSDAERKLESVAKYFQRRLGTHQFLAFAWMFYDVMALSIVVGNFFLTDALLGGWFRNYGIKVVAFLNEETCPTKAEDAFPKLTKCTFYKFGAGGSLQNFDSICVLALNVVNEKVYVVLWFWFLLLIPFSLLWLLLKVGAFISLKCLSKTKLKGLVQLSWVRLLIGVQTATKDLPILIDHLAPSDWIFFSHLVTPMSPATYRTFISHLVQFLEEKYSKKTDV